jgi:alanyl-tRNA synthetase
VKSLQAMGDSLRERLRSGVGILATRLEEGKGALLAVVTDDLRERGVRADAIVREVAAVAGGRGGGKPHMAQAGIPDSGRIDDALAEAPKVVIALVGGV